MKELKIRIQGQTAIWENPFEIISDSQNYLYIRHVLGKDWEGLDVKFLFRDRNGNEVWNSEENTSAVEGTEGLIRIPAEIIKPPYFLVGVLGYGAEDKFVPTAQLKIEVTDNGYDAFSKVTGVSETGKEKLEKLVLSDFKARMDSYAATMAGYDESMMAYANAEALRCEAETERELSEDARVLNENVRKENEQDRQNKEEDRRAFEGDRIFEESERNAREQVRIASEEARCQSEEERKASELDRQASEDIREQAESLRENAESERKASEEERDVTESGRQDAESERVKKENARDIAETLRCEAEASRGNAEIARCEQENQRKEAEAQRESVWQELRGELDSAIGEAQTIAEECEGRADAAVLDAQEAAGQARGVTDLMSNALKAKRYGMELIINDASPLVSTLNIKVGGNVTNIHKYGKNLLNLSNATILTRFTNTVVTVDGNSFSYERKNSGMQEYINAIIPIPTEMRERYVSLSYNVANEAVFLGKGLILIDELPEAAMSQTGVQTAVNTGSYSYLIVLFRISANENYDTGVIKDIQIEIGNATEFEEYKEPVTYVPDEDGNIKGMTLFSPTTTLLGESLGTTISCEYNRDINKAYEELVNAIISLGGNV